MKTTAELIKLVENGEFSSVFSSLYGEEKAESSKDRYLRLLVKFSERFSEERECAFFSAPGRSEIIGNHTDHQHGCAIAQAVDLDTVAVASKNDENVIRIHSLGYSPDEVDITDTEPKSSEFGTSKGIIRGVAAAFKRMGYNIGGFDAVTQSLVPGGSGLSSSAAFEVLLSKILNVFYNEDKASPKEQAIIGKTAENEFFGKPSGLLDQMASSAGGLNFIDFSFKELIKECILELAYVAKDKEIEIITNFVNPEEIIIADMVQIKRVVMNLLSNGIKYAIKNSKLIVNINVESGVLKFSVESNSPYISEAKQKNIFAKYVTYAATNKELGCGLGLYTSKKIIEAHNGKVALKSFKDNRNIFSFEIPQKQNLNKKTQKISL